MQMQQGPNAVQTLPKGRTSVALWVRNSHCDRQGFFEGNQSVKFESQVQLRLNTLTARRMQRKVRHLFSSKSSWGSPACALLTLTCFFLSFAGSSTAPGFGRGIPCIVAEL